MTMVIEAAVGLFASAYPDTLVDAQSPVYKIRAGESAHLQCVILKNGIETTPGSLVLVVKSPDFLTTSTFSLGVDDELVEDSPGRFHLDFLVPDDQGSAGSWSFSWHAQSAEFSKEVDSVFEVGREASEVTLSAVNADLTPIHDALVSVFDSGKLVEQGLTDHNGVWKFSSDSNHTLVASFSKRGFRFPSLPFDPAGPGPHAVEGTDLGFLIDAQPMPLCRLYGQCLGIDGNPPIDECVVIQVVGEGPRSWVGTGSAAVAVTRDRKTVRISRDGGFWECELLQGAHVRVQIPSTALDVTFRVPDLDKLNIRDARPAAGPSTTGRHGDFAKRQ